MRRKNCYLFPLLLAFLLVFFISSSQFTALSQETDNTDTEEEIEEAKEEEAPAEASSSDVTDEEEDPFVDIFAGPEDVKREPGLPGMNISELQLMGIAKVKGEYVGYVKGIDKKPYILRVNQRLRDGYVQKVTDNEVVYMQKVDDPVVKDKYSPIIKRLREEEDK